MAFVQVVRRSMRPEEYTDLRAGWLKRFLYESKYEITDIEITDARQTGENTYEYYPGGYRRLKVLDDLGVLVQFPSVVSFLLKILLCAVFPDQDQLVSTALYFSL